MVHALFQGGIGIALRFGGAVDGTQATQLKARTEAALVAALTAALYLHRAARPPSQSMLVAGQLCLRCIVGRRSILSSATCRSRS
jgi:hypothetical protein